ncbi:NADH-quinone oxidoreductase subunit M [Lacibacter cauensis]|uniref:NADH-quinone oxidoreductase subunit M n=1 Tax=Lacibacter cauensis TaxID=510947 RepID=A0A562SRV8_9BACT|nr:NADH-quinone oxidoreductase subunit M [Lacibacter cauensis]TWI83754.1 NADH-quinone oxidoreductase subunit M [Lacibacter cauensis]
MNLSLLLILPLVFSLLVLVVKGQQQVRSVALAAAVAQLGLSIYLLIQFLGERAVNNAAYLFELDHSWYHALKIHYHVGVDGISVAMILLTSFVVLAGVLVSWKQEKLYKEFFFLLLFLSLGAYGFFLSLDVFLMFFFLEVAVIPKFLLIGIWGSGKKEYSALKLALMLMAGSALVFVGLAGLFFNSNVDGEHTFDIVKLAANPLAGDLQRFFFPFAFIGFGIFTALFPFHTWVPDGHSSAPTAASMFLAGISMKLGGYGCLRVATWLMPDAAQHYSTIIIVLACIAILYGAFATMMQTDLKYINAYSSVSHCGFVLLGIGMLTKTSINGAVLQMVSHGLMTALFFAVIGMIYDRTHTRQVSQLGGLLKVMPFISSVFVIAGLCSLGLPGLSGFVAEMTVFMGSWQRAGAFYHTATIVACASIVVTAVYILRAVGSSIMGPIKNNEHLSLSDAGWHEKTAAVVLLAGILIMGIAPFWLTDLINPGTEVLMQKIGSIK